MSKSKLIAGLTSVAIFATSLAVVPGASAVQLHSEERSGRPICVATLSDREVQVSKDYFQAQIDEYLKLQDRLRAAYPQFAPLYEEVDKQIEQGESFDNYYVRQGFHPIRDVGFEYNEIELFAFKGTDIYRNYTELAKSGLQVNVEIVPGWTKNEMISYPYTTAPVIAVGGNWSSHETAVQSMATQNIVSAMYLGGALKSSRHSVPLRPIVQPHILVLADLQDEFYDSVSYETFKSAADVCLDSIESGNLPPVDTVPITTYVPTSTLTAAPSTVIVTPEPSTVTAEPSTIVVEPAPVTTTALTETVTMTPAPVTSTAPTKTLTENPEPVTTTITPAPVTSTAPAEIIVETPAPVTSTVPAETVTETLAPATSTKARETVVVTPAPVTSTAMKPTVTVTAEPTTITTTPTVTVTADPVEITESEEAPEDNKSEGMGMLPIIIAILAALGGIAGFILNSPAILQGLI